MAAGAHCRSLSFFQSWVVPSPPPAPAPTPPPAIILSLVLCIAGERVYTKGGSPSQANVAFPNCFSSSTYVFPISNHSILIEKNLENGERDKQERILISVSLLPCSRIKGHLSYSAKSVPRQQNSHWQSLGATQHLGRVNQRTLLNGPVSIQRLHPKSIYILSYISKHEFCCKPMYTIFFHASRMAVKYT